MGSTAIRKDYILTVSDVTKMLDITRSSLMRLCKENKISSIKDKGEHLFSRKSVNAYYHKSKRKEINSKLYERDVSGESLSGKELMFVENFLISFSIKQAYEEAGYDGKDAYRSGRALINKPKIKLAIKKRLNKRLKRKEITSEDVVAELTKLAFSTIDDVVVWDNNGVLLKPSYLIDKEVLTSVQEVSCIATQHGTNTKVKLYDKLRALEILAKHTDVIDDSGINMNFNWSVEVVDPEEKVNKDVESSDAQET